MVTDAPASDSVGLGGANADVTPFARFEPYMLINSPRATLPVVIIKGAAFSIPEICGACAAASAATASMAIPATAIRLSVAFPGMIELSPRCTSCCCLRFRLNRNCVR
jgi:hypothetical protein